MKQQFNSNRPLPALALCILCDAMGFITLALPFAGDFLHVIWAPISTLVYFRMFGGKMGVLGGAFSYVEESIPYAQIIPTFTISWLLKSKVFCSKPNASYCYRRIILFLNHYYLKLHIYLWGYGFTWEVRPLKASRQRLLYYFVYINL